MKKQLFIFISFLVLAIATSVLYSFKEPAISKPNIIFLLADDLRYNSLGCLGNSIIKTPNIDQLAYNGTIFKNAFVTTPICAISRASILSGQHANRHKIFDFEKDFTDEQLMNTYPLMLKQGGYYTGFIGKYGVGTMGKTKGANMPIKHFDYWKGFEGHGDYFYKDKNGKDIHSTDMMGDQSIEFINTRDKSKPFCLSVSFKAPHVLDGSPIHNGFVYSPFYENYYKDVTIPRSVTDGDQYYMSFPEPFRTSPKGNKNEARVRWEMRFSTEEKYQESVKSYYRLVTGIDDAVKRIVDELKKKGLEKNTVIIFTSDNGYSLGDHGLEGKWFGHDVSLRVPTIIYDGRNPQDKYNNENLTLNIDLAPTILDYAGLKIPDVMQGKSLKPLVEGKKIEWRTEFYYNHLLETEGVGKTEGSKVYIPKSEGIISLVYKYTRYFMGDNPDNFFFEELFNPLYDPLEINNLASKTEESSRKAAITQRLKDLRERSK
jgi:arylsulfatase A-like enzyme